MSGPRPYWTTSSDPRSEREARPRGRRLLLDGVGVMASLVLIGGAILFFRTRQEREALIERASGELRRVELEMKYRAAAKLPGLNDFGWPASIEEEWFRGPSGVPRNPLVSPERPWIDIAAADEAELEHPVLKMTAGSGLAGFWYNPHLGVIRARVPVMVSDAESLELYNRVNGTRLASIFGAVVSHGEESAASASAERASSPPPAFEITTTGQVLRRSKE